MLFLSRPLALLSMFVLAAFVFGCSGGGGGGGGGSTGGTGAAGVFLTDAPHHGFDEILVTIEELALIGSGGHVTIFSGHEVVDITDLENFSDLFVYADEVPAGIYNKIRMRVSAIELVKDGESIPVDAPANGKLDLLPREHFAIREGITLVIEIDMDANKSIHVVRRGNKDHYNFRPVVKVTTRETASPDKLSRVHGEITEIFDDGGFELCSTRFMAARDDDSEDDTPDGGIGDRHRCMDVELNDETSVFDANGDPTDVAALTVGEEVTVVGRFHILDDNHDDSMGEGAGAGHRNHHAHHHTFSDEDSDSADSDSADSADSDSADSADSDSADSDSADSGDSDSRGSDSADSDSDSDGGNKPRPDLVLLAYVIEIGPVGTFLTLDGVVDSEVVADLFDFAVDPGQGFGDDSVLSSLLQDGTRIFSRKGEPLDETAIVPDTRGTLDGVLEANSEDTVLKTALVVLDVESDVIEVLRGSILRVDEALRSLLLDVGEEGTPEEECVDVPEDADIFLVSEGEDGSASERVELDALFPGLRTDVHGMFEDGVECFVADTVIGFPVECETSAECGEGQFCAKDDGLCEERGWCQNAPMLCTLDYVPVCGCDEVTYSNACAANAAGVSVDREGECGGGGPIVCGGELEVACPDGQVCHIEDGVCDAAAEGECVAEPDACPDVIDPVCSCDGETYGNACLALRAGASVSAEGLCEDSGVCAGPLELECGDGEVCLVRDQTCDPKAEGRCVKEPSECPDVDKPVCGCDGTTYANECTAAKAGAPVSFPGECEGRVSCGGMDGLSCFEGESCLTSVGKCESAGICISTPEFCPDVELPVCGCDGNDYANGCTALASGVSVESIGACDDLPLTCGGPDSGTCAEGFLCVRAPGMCDEAAPGLCTKAPPECPDTAKPVCGCDQETYRNVCEAALMGVTVSAQGRCVDTQPVPEV